MKQAPQIKMYDLWLIEKHSVVSNSCEVLLHNWRRVFHVYKYKKNKGYLTVQTFIKH